ncbi:MAG: cytochrome C biogenesis protein [Planctomycetes bacterium]|nr:cytochrome C biogenesis protein [Planctomycetota bacterium]
MIQDIFSYLSRLLESSPSLAITAAFIWGILSILLSPCHLASIPLVVAFISQDHDKSIRRAFGLSILFASGILVTIALIGLITASIGRMTGDIGPYGNYIVAIIFFIIGLHFLGVIPLPWSGIAPTSKRKGWIAAFLLGLIFGMAMGPCTFAYMAPILGLTFKVAATNFAYAVLLLLVYGIGHCSVIVVAGTSTKAVQSYLNWAESSKSTAILKTICGIFIISGGIYLIWIA